MTKFERAHRSRRRGDPRRRCRRGLLRARGGRGVQSRMSRRDAALNAFVVETPEHALAAADAADAARVAGDLKPLSGVPLGIKDLFCTEGRADHGRLEASSRATSRSTKAPSRAICSPPAPACSASSTWTSSPWARPTRPAATARVLSPWRRNDGGNAALTPGRQLGRLGGGGLGAARARRHRHRHRRLDPPARRLHRHHRHQADLRPLLALGHRRLRLLARPGRADGARRARLRDPARSDGGLRSQGFDLAEARRAQVGGESRRRRPRQAHRHPEGISDRRRSRRDRRGLGAGHSLAEGRGRRDRRGLAAAHQICAAGLLHHRPGRGLVQPRPL